MTEQRDPREGESTTGPSGSPSSEPAYEPPAITRVDLPGLVRPHLKDSATIPADSGSGVAGVGVYVPSPGPPP